MLALLAIEGERSRYDLMKSLSKAIGYIWAPAKTQLYALLPKLAERGLATSRTVREGARPEKKLFQDHERRPRRSSISGLQQQPESAETFYLRLFVGGLVPPEVLVQHVEWFRERTSRSSRSTGRSSRRTRARTTTSSTTSSSASASSAQSTSLSWSDWVLEELEAA